jgi:hypothetical protein
MTPSQPEYAKKPPQTGGSSYFFMEKSPETAYFLYKKPLTRYNSNTFCDE